MKCATDCAVENSWHRSWLARRHGDLGAACANFRIRARNQGPAPPAHRRNSPAAQLLPVATASRPRSGLPWDDRQQKGFFTAFIETLQMVLTRPAEAFTVMKREGGFGEPLIYASHRRQRGRDCVIPVFASFALVRNVCGPAKSARRDGRHGYRFDRVHYPCSTRHRHRLVYCRWHCSSLLDDCRRSEPTF